VLPAMERMTMHIRISWSPELDAESG